MKYVVIAGNIILETINWISWLIGVTVLAVGALVLCLYFYVKPVDSQPQAIGSSVDTTVLSIKHYEHAAPTHAAFKKEYCKCH